MPATHLAPPSPERWKSAPSPAGRAAPPTTDRELVLLAQAGSAEAREALAGRFRPVALGMARSFAKNPEDARDLTQEALLRFFSTLPKFDPTRPVGPWLKRIVVNGAIDLHRRQKLRRADSLDSDGPEGSAIEVTAKRTDPVERADRRRLEEEVQRALSRLRPHHREILILRDFRDLKYREIAERLRIPLGTVMSRLHGARRRLGEILTGSDAGQRVLGLYHRRTA